MSDRKEDSSSKLELVCCCSQPTLSPLFLRGELADVWMYKRTNCLFLEPLSLYCFSLSLYVISPLLLTCTINMCMCVCVYNTTLVNHFSSTQRRELEEVKRYYILRVCLRHQGSEVVGCLLRFLSVCFFFRLLVCVLLLL